MATFFSGPVDHGDEQLFVDLGLLPLAEARRRLHRYVRDDARNPLHDSRSRLFGTERYVYRRAAGDSQFRVLAMDRAYYLARHGALYKNGHWRLFRMRRRHGAWRTDPSASRLLPDGDFRLEGGVRPEAMDYDLLCAARKAMDRLAGDPIDDTFEIVQSSASRFFVPRRSPAGNGQHDFYRLEKDGGVGQWCFSASLSACHVKRKASMVSALGKRQLARARERARAMKRARRGAASVSGPLPSGGRGRRPRT